MRQRRTRFATTVVAAVLIPLIGLSGCGSDDDDAKDDSPSKDSSASTEPSEDASADSDQAPEGLGSDESPEAEGDGSTPTWALPVTNVGDLLTTAEAGKVSVKIYQVGTEKAPKDGMFVDPDTKESILQEGDELVFVNYVITNNGDPIDLGASRVSITPRYDDWKWMQGMDGSTDGALYESQGVNEDRLGPDGFNDLGVYPLGTGETYSYGDNFEHQKNSPITFTVSITPVDSEGELVHDQNVKAEAKTTIK